VGHLDPLSPSSPLLIRLAEHPPDSTAVVDPDGRQTSFGALAGRSSALAAGLAAQGVRAGQAVVFLIEPGSRFVETLVAIWRTGGLAVPLSPLHTAPELALVVQDAAPLALVASAALAPRLAGAAGREPLRVEDLVTSAGM